MEEKQETWNESLQTQNQRPENKKVAAGVLALVVGAFGVHKFILGYSTEGTIMLLGTVLGIVFSCFFLPIIVTIMMSIISFVEGIIYLTKTDEEFYQTYQVGRKGWF